MSRRGTFEFTAQKSWGDAPEVADAAVATVLVVGDIHGEREHLDNAIACAVHCGADAVVQVGDFWLADKHWPKFKRTESHYMEAAAASPVPLLVIDGNHEVWSSLGRFSFTEAAEAARVARRPLNLGGSLWWAWRGSVWSWGGRRMGALGGAVSVDKHLRELRRHRWPHNEYTRREDLDLLVANTAAEFGGSLDVLFTHDAPSSVRALRSNPAGIPPEILSESNANQGLLDEAAQAVRPEFVLHGHWHRLNRERIHGCTEVVGLPNDGRWGHHAVLSTQPTLRVETWKYPSDDLPHGHVPAGLEVSPGIGVIGAQSVRSARQLSGAASVSSG